MSIWAIGWLILCILFTIGSIILTAKYQLAYWRTGNADQTQCTGFGVVLAKGATPGVVVHEKVHLWTATPWLLFAADNFGWLYFYSEYGLWKSLIIGWFAASIFVHIPLETIADIGGMVAVGPRSFMREAINHDKMWVKKIERFEGWYYDLRTTLIFLLILIRYPPWRFFCYFLAHYERRQERIEERVNKILRKGDRENIHPP